MGAQTDIAWTDATWNVLRGCSRTSAGCTNCYAEAMASRFAGPGLPYEGTITDGRWNGNVRWIEERANDPLRWTRTRRVFVNSMSDVFHPNVPDAWVARIYAVMALSSHTFQVLTKRPDRMRAWLANGRAYRMVLDEADKLRGAAKGAQRDRLSRIGVSWPPPRNVWHGVTVEDQRAANERLPILADLPTLNGVRFASFEPLIGPVDVAQALHGMGPGAAPDWWIIGGESGSHARRFVVEHAHSLVQQGTEWRAYVFFKQLGSNVDTPDPFATYGYGWPAVSHEWRRREDDGATANRWRIMLKDRSGADYAEFPAWAQRREVPPEPWRNP